MTLLGTWGGETPWEIYRTGTPLDEDGDGVIWRCTCPRGEPMGSAEANEDAGYPCKHLRSIWAHACEQGVYDPHVNWTPEGVELGRSCRCRSAEPIALRFGPPIERPPEVPEFGAALNKPCPCGSGRKFKKCEGFGPNRPDGPAHPLLQPPELVGALPPVPPAPPPATPEEQKRREKAERKAKRDEAKAKKSAEIAAILERVHAEEERKRQRRAFLARTKKAQAVIKAVEAREKAAKRAAKRRGK
jgi:hypothetical protein